MPIVRVELLDTRVTEETCAKLIKDMTDVLVAHTSEAIRDRTYVIVEGHPASQWGLGGEPLSVKR